MVFVIILAIAFALTVYVAMKTHIAALILWISEHDIPTPTKADIEQAMCFVIQNTVKDIIGR